MCLCTDTAALPIRHATRASSRCCDGAATIDVALVVKAASAAAATRKFCIDMFHVPYRGSAPALTDLISGQVQVMFDLTASSIGYIRAGQLRALAVTTVKRSALPELPTVGDFVPGYEASAVGGFGAPKGTPVEIIQKLNVEISAGLADPDVRSRYAALGSVPNPGSPADFGKLIADETEKWAKVIKFAGIKAE